MKSADDYYRDACVYRKDIDIYDSMQAIVKYSNGATMAYSLDAHMPFEGFRVAFNGELGRSRCVITNASRGTFRQAEDTEVYVTKSFGSGARGPVVNAARADTAAATISSATRSSGRRRRRSI